MALAQNLVLFGASALAGAVNSVAGGGTLLTFPALLWAGQNAIVANATSTVALWPGQLSSLWGYRKELGQSRKVILLLALPSVVGGTAGALLLLHTSESSFVRIIPFLILLATGLFMAQEPLSRYLKFKASRVIDPTASASAVDNEVVSIPSDIPKIGVGVMVFQFMVAIYGGYFGAGIGILMLAALGFMGFLNIHRMNGLKNINGLCINLAAAILFIGRGLVDWRLALFMAAGSIVGGYCGAGGARRIGQSNVRKLIIIIGLTLSISLFFKKDKPKSAPIPHFNNTHSVIIQ